VCFLWILSFLGNQRNSKPSPYLLLRPSIGLWPLFVVKSYGFFLCLKIFSFLIHSHHLFTVIVRPQFILLRIRCTTNAVSISRLTVILFAKKLNLASSRHFMCLLNIKLLISLPNHLAVMFSITYYPRCLSVISTIHLEGEY
jgi:hypothetical protein